MKITMQEVFAKAVHEGNAEVVRAQLVDHRVDPASNDNAAIRRASALGHAEVVRALLADPRVDPAGINNGAVQWASQRGRAEVVRVLLADPRVDPAAGYNYAIRCASFGGNEAVVRALLADPRVDPGDKDNEAIQWASERGRAEVVRALLADPRVDPRVAIKNSKKECARIIASDCIEQYYDLFETYHPDIARDYRARLCQCYALAWVATQECSWIDAVEPVVKRLKKLLL